MEVYLYLPNDNVDGFDAVLSTIKGFSAGAVVEALIDAGVFNEDVAVNSCRLNGEGSNATVVIDMNAAFGEAMKRTGTTGEYMMMGSLVNSLLEVFGASAAEVTVDGQILETGHSIYDFPLRHMD